MEFYKVHNFLDVKNRKRIVNVLIRAVVERKVERYTAIFHDMTRQLLELFPTEKYVSFGFHLILQIYLNIYFLGNLFCTTQWATFSSRSIIL